MSQPPQPHVPHGQPPVSGPPATIELHVQGNVLVSNLVPPTVTIDGHRIQGVTVHQSVPVQVPPGRRHIKAHSQWMRQYGQAECTVEVAPGQKLDVYYAPPLHQFTTGNMGVEKQPMKGKGCLIALLVVLVVVIVLAFVLTLVFL